MNKAELVKALEERMQSDRKSASAAVDHVVDLIVRSVAKGEKVAITGFGVFEKRRRGARTARNPATGAAVKVKATSVPAFRAGAGFKDVVSGSKKLERVAKAPAASAATSTATRGPAKKSAAKKTAVKATTVKKTAAKKTVAKKSTAKKAVATKAPARAAKKVTARTASPAKKTAAKKTAPARTTAREAAPAKRTTTRTAASARKSITRATTARGATKRAR